MAGDTQPDWRDEPIDYGRWVTWLRENRLGMMLLGFGIVIIIVGFLFLYPANDRSFRQFVADLYANGGAELVSISITVLIVDSLNRRRAKRDEEIREQQFKKEAEAREKADLILQMGSDNNAFSREAVRKLRARGWLTDGSIMDAYLSEANLSTSKLYEANLTKATLQSANLSKANLKGIDLREAKLIQAILTEADLGKGKFDRADLSGSDLSKANLRAADLSQTYLIQVILRDADLKGASLRGADLYTADLTGTNLIGAKLQDADLTGVCLKDANLIGAIMPNGKEWYPGMDLEQFTNPERPDFWRSDNSESPAYRGEDSG